MSRAEQALFERLRSSWLGIVSAFVLSVQTINLAHVLLVRHAVCAEHGEAIELDSTAHSVASAARADNSRPSIKTEAAVSGEHEHCELAIQNRTHRAIVAQS